MISILPDWSIFAALNTEHPLLGALGGITFGELIFLHVRVRQYDTKKS